MTPKEYVGGLIRLRQASTALAKAIADSVPACTLGFRVPPGGTPTEFWEGRVEEQFPMAGDVDGSGVWDIIPDPMERTLVGTCIMNRVELQAGGFRAEASIELLPQYQRCGLGTNSFKTILKYLFGFDDTAEVMVQSDVEHAIRMAKRLGFKTRIDESFNGIVLLCLTREEYEEGCRLTA